MIELDRREAALMLSTVIFRIHARGWCEGTSGNYSIVLQRDPLELLVTRTGADKRLVGPADLLLIDADANPLDEDAPQPSSETPLHTTLAAGFGAGAVLHTHSVWGTLLGEHHLEAGVLPIQGYEMIKGITGRTTHEDTLEVPVFANTQDMVALAGELESRREAIVGARGFLIAGHGLYTYGSDLDEAARHVEIHEFLFEVVGRKTWPR